MHPAVPGAMITACRCGYIHIVDTTIRHYIHFFCCGSSVMFSSFVCSSTVCIYVSSL